MIGGRKQHVDDTGFGREPVIFKVSESGEDDVISNNNCC